MSDEEKRRWKKPATEKTGSGRSVTERKVIARNARSESSKKWIERQLQDPYVRKAMDAGIVRVRLTSCSRSMRKLTS